MHKLLIFFFIAACSQCEAAELVEEFDGPPLNARVWNTCQARTDLLRFASGSAGGDLGRFLEIVVDESTANVDQCIRAVASLGLAGFPGLLATLFETAPDNGRDLGPSLIAPARPATEAPEDCPTGGSVQRNELRFNGVRHVHDWREPHWYSLTFRIEGQIPHCGSARWVVGQWKQRIIGDESPVIAQRFDNGVLHVTVQDENCRCMVAKAKGDPERLTLLEGSMDGVANGLRESSPLGCIDSTRLASESPRTCMPVTLTVLTAGGRPPPDLPDPSTQWVTMTYRIKGGDGGQVDVYANRRFIVRVMGHIGYAAAIPGLVKFKIGHYRDRMPGSATLKLDRV